MSEFQPYPGWRTHADGRTCLVNTEEEDAALGEGWTSPASDTPPDELDGPMGREADAAAASPAFQSYPSWRHHVDGRSCEVADEEADRTLGEGWYRSRDLATSAQIDPPPTPPTATAQRQAFYETPTSSIVERVQALTPDHVEQLHELRRWEVVHPKYAGGRKGVLAAIDEQLASFVPPA